MIARAVETKVSPVMNPANSPKLQVAVGPMNIARLPAASRFNTKIMPYTHGIFADRTFSIVTPDSRIQALPKSGPYHIPPTESPASAATNIASQLTCTGIDDVSMTPLRFLCFLRRDYRRSCFLLVTQPRS